MWKRLTQKTPKRWQQIEIFDITFSLINDLNFPKKNVLERLNIDFLIFKLARPDIRLRLELLRLAYFSVTTG